MSEEPTQYVYNCLWCDYVGSTKSHVCKQKGPCIYVNEVAQRRFGVTLTSEQLKNLETKDK